MKQIKSEPIYNGYTPDIRGRYIVVRKGRKYVYVQIESTVQWHYPIVLKYAVADTARVLADITNEVKYIDFAEEVHHINDGDYYAALLRCKIVRPLAVIKEPAIR